MKHLKTLLLVLSVGFIACETEDLGTALNEEGLNTELSTSVNLEASVEEADDVLDDIALYSGSYFGISSSYSQTGKDDDDHHGDSGYFENCADIEVVEEENSITVTMTFTGECEDRNGNAITGTLIKTETYTEGNSENTLTITDFNINGYVINGVKTYSWTSANENGNPEMSGTVSIEVETSEGTITKTGNRTVEITEGADTRTWVDNTKSITGSYSYEGLGTSFSMEITTPLVKPAACKFIVSGVKTYTTAEGTTTLDYGDGTCDGFATMTLPDGTTEEVTLGRRRGEHQRGDRDGHRDDDEDDDDEDHDDSDDNDDSDDDDDDSSLAGCVLKTSCGEIEFDNVTELSVEVSEENGVYTIVVTNTDGEIVYSEECSEDGNASLECSSDSDGD